MADILYQDKQITVCKDVIVINKYYYPIATSRSIFFKDIENVTLEQCDTHAPQWGLCTKYLKNWFPYDEQRDHKRKFIEITVKDEFIRPSITPDFPDIVYGLLWEYRAQQGAIFRQQCEEKLAEDEERRIRKMSEGFKKDKEMNANKNPEEEEKKQEVKGRKVGKENPAKKDEKAEGKIKQTMNPVDKIIQNKYAAGKPLGEMKIENA